MDGWMLVLKCRQKKEGNRERELPSVQARRDKDEIISRIIHAITVALALALALAPPVRMRVVHSLFVLLSV